MKRVVLACLAAACCALGTAAVARAATPVPSLTPVPTHRLWTRLVRQREAAPLARARAADCRPTRVVIYAQSDWLRAATVLAQNASPCAEYYVSIPPLAANKSQPRPGQPALIRALGPNFHALAEISWNGWSQWVAANGSNWAQAGVVARQRMAAAGYDVSAGDTWAVNEASSALRANTGASRQNLRDFIRGLYTGDGAVPQVKGVVFVIGVGQPAGDLSAYKAKLQSWFQDEGFWSDIGAYVSDWGQEVYGDARDYAVAGTVPQQRRDVLEQYLGHPLTLVRSAPPEAGAAATTILDGTYLPLGNAAWAWASAYGWTLIPFDQMEDYVTAQVYAERALAAQTQASVDRIGFAWAPQNRLGLSNGDFTREGAAILTRLGEAIRDSGATDDSGDPGVGACGPIGQPMFCMAVIDGAAFPTAWEAFGTWTPATVGFVSSPPTVTAGAPSASVQVQLQTGTVASAAIAPTTLVVSTTSLRGTFATAPTGPWSHTLTLTIPTGGTSAAFFYADPSVGTPTIAVGQPGQPAATQIVTVVPAAPVSLSVSANPSAVVDQGKTIAVTATGRDAFGNSFPVQPRWTVVPPALGTIRATPAGATFAPGPSGGKGRIVATVGGATASLAVTVVAPPPRVRSAVVRLVKHHLVATVQIVRGALPAPRLRITLHIRRAGIGVANLKGRTDAAGRYVWRSPGTFAAGRYTVTVGFPRPRP